MKRATFLTLLCIFYFFQLHAQSGFNLDMEVIDNLKKLPKGWFTGFTSNQPSYHVTLDSSVKQNGKYALALQKLNDGAGFGACTYVIEARYTAKKIKLKGFLKTENVTDGYGGLWMRIDGESGMLAFDNMGNRGVTGTTDWQPFIIELNYNAEEATLINVGALLVGNGKLWVDNLSISLDSTDIALQPLKKVIIYKASLDTAFNKESGVPAISLTPMHIQNLTNLGMLWGFLKYHHPSIATGNHNWDASLFRILPQVVKAASKNDANKILERWVDSLGLPDKCKLCPSVTMDSSIKLLPDHGNLFTKGNLSASLISKLKYIKENRNEGKSYYITLAPNVGNPQFKNELQYNSTSYPDTGLRLLALFRYWSMIQYYFPYKHLIGEDWNEVLPALLPKFINAKDSTTYVLACLELIGRIHDTHANIWGNNRTLNAYRGNLMAPIQTKFIEEQLVVTGYYTNDTALRQKLHTGDVVTHINSIAVKQLVKKKLPFTLASNYSTQLRDLPGILLRSNLDTTEVTIQRSNQRMKIKLNNKKPNELNRQIDYDPSPKDSSYKIINGNIGYIYPGKYKNVQLESIKKTFVNTIGIVVDMRCYPSDFMPFTFGAYIKPAASPFVKFAKGDINTPGLFKLTSDLTNGINNPAYYKGKVVIIVNEQTQSQAEYTTMAFSSAPNVTVIGSTTAGADGNISEIRLPGGIYTYISGIGIYYPDGTETQRTGVKIDHITKPTIRGFQKGSDELLDKAIEIITH